MKRWSLRVRFLSLLIILLLAVFAAITLIIVRENTKTLRGNLFDQSKSFATLATQPIGNAYETYKDSGTIRIQQKVASFADLDPNISQVEIIDTNAKRVFTNNMQQPMAVSADAAASLDTSYIYDKKGSLTAVVQPYVEDFGIHRYAVVYGISSQSINKNIRDIVTFIVIFSAGILLVSLAVWYFLINRLFLRPVALVSQEALLVSRGDLDRQIQVARRDEIGDLATAVNTMASSLKADIAKLKETDRLKSEFLMITAHNLRTPLTIIKGYLEQLTSLKPDPKLQKLLELIANNVTRLDGFSEDALTISTIEADASDLPRSPLEMQPVLQDSANEFERLAKQKNIHFTANIATPAWVNLSRPHFRSALWNLLDNAYKFTPEDGTIGLTVTTTDNRLNITIKDSGIGIDAVEIPHLFTKFHRATDTLRYNYEGTGIGLYISKLVINQYGGNITVESAKDNGSAFTISLPTIPPPTSHS